jgi:hypothetical protein
MKPLGKEELSLSILTMATSTELIGTGGHHFGKGKNRTSESERCYS